MFLLCMFVFYFVYSVFLYFLCIIPPFLYIYIYIYIYVCVCVYIYMCVCVCVCVYIQGVTGGTDQTSGGCSLCYTIPI